MTMPIVVIESPYRGATRQELARNIRYVRAALRDCLLRGEAPVASHALYSQQGVLSDRSNIERELGMSAGWRFLAAADRVAVYQDLGISPGMERGIQKALAMGLSVDWRNLPGFDWKGAVDK